MKNLWKLFAVAAVAVMPMTVKAAAAVNSSTGVCTAATIAEIKTCNAAKTGTDGEGAKSITVSGSTFTIDSDLTLTMPITFSGAVTIDKDVDVKVTVSDSGNVSLVGLTATSIEMLSGSTLNVSANNGSSSKGTDNTATAISTTGGIKFKNAKITVDKGKIVSDMTDNGSSTNSTISVQKVEGNVTVGNATKFTATDINVGVTGKTVTVNKGATLIADNIEGTVKVEGDDNNTATAYYVAESPAATLTVSDGIAKVVVYNDDDDELVDHYEVYIDGVDKVSLAADDVLVIDGTENIDELTVTAKKGAQIQNDSSSTLTITVNGKEVEIEAGDTYEVTTSSSSDDDTTTDPDTTTPSDTTTTPGTTTTDPDTSVTAPKTGDTVLVSTAVGLISLAGLAVTVKARKMN